MKIQMLGGRIIVKPLEKSTSDGGLYLPETSRERPQRGEVLAIGGGERLENGEVVPCQAAPGNVILFSKYAGQEFEFAGGLDVLIMLDKEVIMILDPPRDLELDTAGPVVDLQPPAPEEPAK